MYTNKFARCNIPITSYIPFQEIEESALQQLINCTCLPFTFKHVVALPDVHAGNGISIGTVLATKNVIVPNAVGVDIGCGMYAVKTSLNVDEIDTTKLKSIMGLIRRAVPLGFDHRKIAVNIPEIFIDAPIVMANYSSAKLQCGTLGGGNHFIEIQKEIPSNIVWFMIHSGSRNLGKKVGDFYNKKAIELNEKYYTQVPNNWQLAFLPIGSTECRLYLNEMKYCVEFAFANRQMIGDIVKESIMTIFPNTEFEEPVNIAHNYARIENHFGQNVWVHRKGATSSKENELGIIPGSQGTSSYIVKGKGNPDSFMSCSHGAGRTMSRTNARKTLDLENEKKLLDDKGIIHSIRGIQDLDESSSAYKNIDIVMERQKDLVDIICKLEPLAVIKG